MSLTFLVLREEKFSEKSLKYGQTDTQSDSMSYDAREKYYLNRRESSVFHTKQAKRLS
jgi:hypothetical protein